VSCATVLSAPVAHSVELWPFKPQVPGSKPGGGTTVDRLPVSMQTKIALEPCPVPGLDGPCWIWQNCLGSRGYGCVGIDGKVQLTHRVAYQRLVGPIPDGLQIDHLCFKKRCCNPAHLEPVTGKVNCERAWPAMKTLCVNGHHLAGDNLIIKKRRNGLTIRNCRECQIASQRRSYRKALLRAAAS
jgi:hypothetical protein